MDDPTDQVQTLSDDALLDDSLPAEAEAKLQRLQAEQRAREAAFTAQRDGRRRLWHTHHWPDEYERCALVGSTHICRRCLTLYPVAIAAMLLSFAGFTPWPERLDLVFIWGLCIPATADFLAEKLWNRAYSARRQVAVTALVGVALGRGFVFEIRDRWSTEFWGPVLVFGLIWFLAAVNHSRRNMFAAALENSSEYGAVGHGERASC